MEEREEEQSNLLLSDSSSSSSSSSLLQQSASAASSLVPETPFKRTGNVWTAVAHIITGVIGSGVLSLAWSVAQLGWVAGPVFMVVMAFITIYSSHLVCDCYKTSDCEYGTLRNRSFSEAVSSYLGEKNMWISSVFVNISYYGYGLAYTITSAISIRAILMSNCYHRNGREASCEYGDTIYMIMFGALQIIFSQIPNFHSIEWLSIIAAAMSFCYAFIGFGLSFAKVIGNGKIRGSIYGVSSSKEEKVWLIAQAIGDVTFSFNFNTILLEIQDTIDSPPAESRTMKKACTRGIFMTTFFYIFCGCFGYAAFGDATPGNLLTGFYEPYWLVDFANACIVVHLVGGYQVYTQPLFASAERWLASNYPENRFSNKSYTIKLPKLPVLNINWFRLIFRTAYVISTTLIALVFPYFNQVLGVLGALSFWPLAIYFPVQMYFTQAILQPWSKQWIALQAFSLFCLLGTLFALSGSIEGLINARSS